MCDFLIVLGRYRGVYAVVILLLDISDRHALLVNSSLHVEPFRGIAVHFFGLVNSCCLLVIS